MHRNPRTRLICIFLFIACLSSLAASSRGFAQQRLTLDWVFGEDGRAVGRVPAFAWLDDGAAIIYDARRPAAERTFEKLDPATGKQQPIVDAGRAVASLKSVASDAETDDGLPWPVAFDGAGREALYLFNGDVLVLDIAAARFQRITSTAAEEKSASFSPDGRSVSYVRNNDLYVFDLTANREARITQDGSDTVLNGTLSWVYWEEVFGRRDIGYWWSPDSRAIAYLQSDDSHVDLCYFVDFKPFSPRVIQQRYARAGRPNPSVRVGVVELGHEGTRWIQVGDKPFEYIVRVKWLPDSRRLSFETMVRAQTELSLYLADRSTGVTSRILTETDPGWVNMTDDLFFLKDGLHFLWPSERDGYMHLYRYRLDGMLENQVTKGPWALASAGGIAFWVRQALVGVDEKEDWVYFTALEKSSIERHLYRVHADGSGMMRVSKETGTHRISMPSAARYYLDTFSDIRTLPALVLHGADGTSKRTLAAPRPELLAQYGVQYPELLTIPADDGFAMPTQIIKPKEFQPDRKYPIILFVYGGTSAPQVSNGWQQNVLWHQLLLDAGYVIVQVDNRSATAISKILENTVLGHLGEAETPDFLAAVRWLKKQRWVDGSRVGVWGWSYGGTMTLNLMTRSQEFKAGIAVAPVTDWRYYDSKWTESVMRRPQDNPAGYESTSVVKRAGQLHGSLLIVHGTYDDNVHPENEHAFIDALVAAGKPFEMMAYPMRKHGITDTEATRHLYRTMLEFWKRNL